eukprot:1162074-Pelagomonas_calceolata.AAC.10
MQHHFPPAGMHHSQGTQVHTPPGADGHASSRPATSEKQGDGVQGGGAASHGDGAQGGGAAPAPCLDTPGSLQR